MSQLYVAIILWDIPIYFICGVGLLFALVQLGRARRILRTAMFGLEREQGQALRNRSLSFIGLFGLVLGAVLYVNLQIAPSLPAELLRPPTPTPDLFATPFSSPTPLGEQVNNATRPSDPLQFAPTATLGANVAVPVVVAGTAEATATPSLITGGGDGFIPAGGGCTPAVSISQPRPGTAIFGTVEFYGTATDPDFAQYLVEIRGEATSNAWVNVFGSDTVIPVSNGLLGAINLSSLTNGDYEARLSVLDSTGTTTGQCVITIAINNE